jgi:hypothetical protein
MQMADMFAWQAMTGSFWLVFRAYALIHQAIVVWSGRKFGLVTA